MHVSAYKNWKLITSIYYEENVQDVLSKSKANAQNGAFVFLDRISGTSSSNKKETEDRVLKTLLAGPSTTIMSIKR